MALPPVALKRRNHRLLHCTAPQKNSLLARLVSEHESKRILVITAGDPDYVTLPENVTLLTDATLGEAENGAFDLLISFDLPETPQAYLDRLEKAAELALILLGEADRPHLYGIETRLGRTIIQESIPEFAPQAAQPPKAVRKPAAQRRDDPKGKMPPRSDAPREKRDVKAGGKRPAKRPDGTKPQPKRVPKASGASRYLGKDENGKPIFSDKPVNREDGGKKPYGKPDASGKGKPAYNRDKKPYDKKKSDSRDLDRPALKSEAKRPEKEGQKRPMRRIKASEYTPSEAKKPDTKE